MAALVVAGCTTSSSRGRKTFDEPRDTWESEEKRARKRRTIQQTATAKPKLSVKQQAARFASGDACHDGALARYHEDQGGGWALLKACVSERGYADIERLLETPWDSFFRGDWNEGAKLLALVSAIRGGAAELDAGLARRHGFDFASLDEVLRDPAPYKGQFMLLRSKVIERVANARGVTLMLTGDRGEIRARMPQVDLRIGAGEEFVFLVRFDGVDPAATGDLLTATALVTIVSYHRPGAVKALR